MEGEREETEAVVCLSESEGINVDDDVINEVDRCGARRKAERALAREKNRRTHGHFSQPDGRHKRTSAGPRDSCTSGTSTSVKSPYITD